MGIATIWPAASNDDREDRDLDLAKWRPTATTSLKMNLRMNAEMPADGTYDAVDPAPANPVAYPVANPVANPLNPATENPAADAFSPFGNPIANPVADAVGHPVADTVWESIPWGSGNVPLPDALRTDQAELEWEQQFAATDSSSRNTTHETVIDPDGNARPRWARGTQAVRDYYDHKWGFPCTDEQDMFEALCFAVFQTGIAIRILAAKWTAMGEVFADFDPAELAQWPPSQVDLLLADPRVVRNRNKIQATLANAKATVALREQGGLVRLVWEHQPLRTPVPLNSAEVPRKIPESAQLARALRARGFKHVGPVMACFFMAATGVIDNAVVGTLARGRSGLWNEDGSRRPHHLLGRLPQESASPDSVSGPFADLDPLLP